MSEWEMSDGLLGAPKPKPVSTRKHPYQSDVDYLRDVGAQLEVNGATGAPTSEPVLDAGRFGLEFFRRFGNAYTEITGERAELERRYDTHREVNYQRLRTEAERHLAVAAEVGERILDFRNGASPVFEAWQGEAAQQAKTRFDAFLTRAEQVRRQFTDLAEVLTAVVEAADRALYEQAAGVAGLWTDRVGTLSAADVEFVLDFARRCAAPQPGPLILDDEIRRVAGYCGIEVNPILCRLNQDTFGVLGADVRAWLETVFVPFYRARAAAVLAHCTAADTVLTGAWQALTTMLGDVDANPFRGLFEEQAAPVAAPVVVDDRPVPDTPADQPGGISSALDGRL